MADLLSLNVEQGHRRPQGFHFQQNSIIDGSDIHTMCYLLVIDLVNSQFYLLQTFLPEMCRAQHETMNFHADGIYRR